MNFVIGEAAHKYGFDNLMVPGPLGSLVSATPSSDPSTIGVGGSLSVTELWSNGFTAVITVIKISNTAVALTNGALVFGPTGEIINAFTGNLSITASQLGNLSDDSFILSGADTITGNSANNVLKGYGGNDRIDGGAGTDTAVYSGFRSQYSVVKGGNAFQVTGPEGADTLLNIERIKFDDVTIANDTNGAAGQAYRLYQAALGRAPDTGGLGAQTKALDAGVSLHDIAQNFINSAEFSAKYGALNNTQFVTQLYANVLHRLPDSGGLAFHVNALNTGLTRADDLIGFSESNENQAALLGVISNGMVYTS